MDEGIDINDLYIHICRCAYMYVFIYIYTYTYIIVSENAKVPPFQETSVCGC